MRRTNTELYRIFREAYAVRTIELVRLQRARLVNKLSDETCHKVSRKGMLSVQEQEDDLNSRGKIVCHETVDSCFV